MSKDVETQLCPTCGAERQTPGVTLLADIQIRISQCQNAVFDEWEQVLKGWRDFVTAAIKAQSETNSEKQAEAIITFEWRCICGQPHPQGHSYCWACGQSAASQNQPWSHK